MVKVRVTLYLDYCESERSKHTLLDYNLDVNYIERELREMYFEKCNI